ncbi:MAG: hypothetical protein AB8B86_01730 [Pseudomonadales bacterium]
MLPSNRWDGYLFSQPSSSKHYRTEVGLRIEVGMLRLISILAEQNRPDIDQPLDSI